jgi:hypothetical protein
MGEQAIKSWILGRNKENKRKGRESFVCFSISKLASNIEGSFSVCVCDKYDAMSLTNCTPSSPHTYSSIIPPIAYRYKQMPCQQVSENNSFLFPKVRGR